MISKLLSLLALVSLSAFAQTTVTLSLTGTAAVVGFGPNFTLTGTANLSTVGTAVLSGAGTIPNQILTGQQSGPIPGTFTMIFANGEVMYGTFSIPSGFIFTNVGGSTNATGNVTITGGSGRYSGARGVFPNVTGSGTAINSTSASVTLNTSGTFATGYKILSQVPFGGGWYSALYFTNSSNTAASFTLSMFADNGSPLSVPAFNGATSTAVSIPAGGSARVELLNSGPLQQGYASMVLPEGVTGYGVFRQSVANTPDQEAVVPLANGFGTSGLLTFDDTNFITAVALVNPSDAATTVNIVATSATGAPLGSGTVALPARSKTAVALRNIPGLNAVTNSRGSATFSVTTGNLTVLGLRFFGTAFTSIPAEQ